MSLGDKETIWTDDRRKLQALLNALDSELAGLYQHCVDLVASQPIAGQERTRLALVGHCLRELVNTLPDALRDVPKFPANKGKSDSDMREALIAEYEDFAGPPADVSPVDDTDEDGQRRFVTVPQSLLNSVHRWVVSQNDMAAREIQRDAAVVLGYIDTRDPALKPWKAARRFMMKYVHLNRKYPTSTDRRTLPSEAEILNHLENIEAALSTRLGGFFDSLDSLKDLIAQANETVSVDQPS